MASTNRDADFDNYFQTTASATDKERRQVKSANKAGRPIRFSSKLTSVIPDPFDPYAVYVAESTGNARRVNLQSSATSHIFRGPTAPLTSLAILPLVDPHRPDVEAQSAISRGSVAAGYSNNKSNVTFRSSGPPAGPAPAAILFAGCWDKSIWSFNTVTKAPGPRFHGHRDFVKCLLLLPNLGGSDVLVSGSADGSIMFWNARTGRSLATVKAHERGVLALEYDPEQETDDEIRLFSGSSDRTINIWSVAAADNGTLNIKRVNEDSLLPHETSVTALHFPITHEADLFTASADTFVKSLSRDADWSEDLSFPHPSLVKCMTSIPATAFSIPPPPLAGSFSATASPHVEPEQLKTLFSGSSFLIASGTRSEDIFILHPGQGARIARLRGHFDELTSLCVAGPFLVSVSLDGTLRRWTAFDIIDYQSTEHPEDDDEKADPDIVLVGGSTGIGARDMRHEEEDDEDHKVLTELTEDEEMQLMALNMDDGAGQIDTSEVPAVTTESADPEAALDEEYEAEHQAAEAEAADAEEFGV